MPDIETASEKYAARFRGPTGAWFLRIQEQAVLRMLAARPGQSVLDVGGGHAQLAGPVRQAGYPVTVHGSAPVCRQRLDADPITRDCPFVVSPATALPLAARAFDAVVSVRLLAHHPQWEALVAELCRVASHTVIVDFPCVSGLNRAAPVLFRAKLKVEGNTRHWQQFDERQVRDAFARHGFAPADRYKQFFLPMALYRTLRCQPLAAALEGCFRVIGATRVLGSPVIAAYSRNPSPPAPVSI